MKFETVRIHFLSDVLVCCHPQILLPWQRDVTTSPLYWRTDRARYLLGAYYFGGARSKGFARLRNVSKLTFFDKIGHVKPVGFRFYSAIWRSESRISSRYLEITSISLIYSLTFSRKKELLFRLSRSLNQLTCVTRQIRADSKAQFRRRASALPNLTVIWFDCSTAGKQLWFRRRARVEPNSGFTDAS